MIYGLYLSATGVVTNLHKQDVIANNLANVETQGFRRQLVSFMEREPARSNLSRDTGDPMFELIGGGQLVAPSRFDYSQGTLENTSSNLDVAVNGEGFFEVESDAGRRLTRNGSFMLTESGDLVLSTDNATKVLDASGQTINLGAGVSETDVSIDPRGGISVRGIPTARLSTVTVADKAKLGPTGDTLLKPSDDAEIAQSEIKLMPGFVERSNVEPATELTRLMMANRQLEANANMLKYQDQTLQRLVNEVGKIG